MDGPIRVRISFSIIFHSGATEIASNVAIAAAAEASGEDGVPVGLGFTVPYGKDANGRKLILVRYPSDGKSVSMVASEWC